MAFDRRTYMQVYWKTHPSQYAAHKKRTAQAAARRRQNKTGQSRPSSIASVAYYVTRRELRRAIEEVQHIPKRRSRKERESMHPIPPSDKLHISNNKWIYTMKWVTMRKLEKQGIPTTCYYHEGADGKEIKVGQVVYSASTTRTRTFRILSHLECAMRKGLVLESELKGKFFPKPLNTATS